MNLENIFYFISVRIVYSLISIGICMNAHCHYQFLIQYFGVVVIVPLFGVVPFSDDSQQVTLPNLAAQKKNSSRRNAWGNLSYADLITQAITSAVDNRLTLSQIYEWMVQNVPYFKDKGDSNSSAGWKVS